MRIKTGYKKVSKKKGNLGFGGGAAIRRVGKGEFDEGSMLLLRFQGWPKPSTDTNKLLFFFPIYSSWDFDLSPMEIMFLVHHYVWKMNTPSRNRQGN